MGRTFLMDQELSPSNGLRDEGRRERVLSKCLRRASFWGTWSNEQGDKGRKARHRLHPQNKLKKAGDTQEAEPRPSRLRRGAWGVRVQRWLTGKSNPPVNRMCLGDRPWRAAKKYSEPCNVNRNKSFPMVWNCRLSQSYQHCSWSLTSFCRWQGQQGKWLPVNNVCFCRAGRDNIFSWKSYSTRKMLSPESGELQGHLNNQKWIWGWEKQLKISWMCYKSRRTH